MRTSDRHHRNHHNHHHNHHHQDKTQNTHRHHHQNQQNLHPGQSSRSVSYLDATVKEILEGGYNLTKERQIGSGYSSVVSKCIYKSHVDHSETIIAVKTIMKEKPKISYLSVSEIALLRKCRDNNVVRFESAVECRDAFVIITEYCSKGDMFANLKYLDDKLTREYMVGILRGIGALHSRLVAHCDIKMKNILITEDNVIKLADFGFAVQLRTEFDKIDVLNGTQDYWSPEMDIVPASFNPFAADIYALGVTFVGMLERRAIKRKNDNIYQIVMDYEDVNQRRMLQGMLKCDPAIRWSLAQIQSNEWLSDETPPPSPT